MVKHQHLTYRDVKSLTNAIYRERLKKRPNLPKSAEEVLDAVDNMQDEHFDIVIADKDSGIIVFSTTDNLHHLSTSDHILGDGTFKSCPKFFVQLYTWHAFKNGTYLPSVYCLLPNKTTSTYKKMLCLIFQETEARNFSFNPPFVHLDLEISMHKAVRILWPTCSIKVCNFHLGQCWFRKLQSLGLTQEYRAQDSEIGNWLKIFFSMPALPKDEIEDCFAFEIMAAKPIESKNLDEFADYILNTYITSNCSFPPSTWAGLTMSDVTTTNACESFHLHFEHSVATSHPNIFKFIDALHIEQNKCTLKQRALAQPPAKKRKILQQKEENRKKLMDAYMTGEMTRFELLKKLCTKMLPPRL